MRHKEGSISALPHDLDVLLRIIRSAGALLQSYLDLPANVRWKGPGDPVTPADKAVNALLVQEIAAAFPDDGLLTEESPDDLSRLTKRRVWMVDPLDGTNEYVAGNGEYCIMVGLTVDGIPSLGVIYRPVVEAVFAAAAGAGAFAIEDGRRFPLHVSQVADLESVRPVVSRSHRPPLLDGVLNRLRLQPEMVIGSLGLKAGALATGQADAYLHPGRGPKEWDTCAPECILNEAGGRMTDCFGRPLTYNRRDVERRSGIIGSNGLCHEQLVLGMAPILEAVGVTAETGF